MKIRHAAALALAGWHLRPPPPQSFVNQRLGRPDEEAPLSRWRNEDQFYSLKECQVTQLKYQRKFAAPKAQKGIDSGVVNTAKA